MQVATHQEIHMTGADTGGGAWGAQAPPSSQDNIQASIDIATSSTPLLVKNLDLTYI